MRKPWNSEELDQFVLSGLGPASTLDFQKSHMKHKKTQIEKRIARLGEVYFAPMPGLHSYQICYMVHFDRRWPNPMKHPSLPKLYMNAALSLCLMTEVGKRLYFSCCLQETIATMVWVAKPSQLSRELDLKWVSRNVMDRDSQPSRPFVLADLRRRPHGLKRKVWHRIDSGGERRKFSRILG